MKEVDIISKYLESLHAGAPDEQAQLFARSWAQASEPHPSLATKHELELSIEKINSTVSKLSWIVMFVGGIIAIDIAKRWWL